MIQKLEIILKVSKYDAAQDLKKISNEEAGLQFYISHGWLRLLIGFLGIFGTLLDLYYLYHAKGVIVSSFRDRKPALDS